MCWSATELYCHPYSQSRAYVNTAHYKGDTIAWEQL